MMNDPDALTPALDPGFHDEAGTDESSATTYAASAFYTNDQIATYLTNGYWTATGGSAHRWNTNTITYNVTGLTAAGQDLARNAFAEWASVCALSFVETTGSAMVRLDDAFSGAYASASYSGGITTSATINVGTGWLATYGTGLKSYSFQTYIHEIGHVLGLGHAGPYNGSAAYGYSNAYVNDSWQATIMSYFSQDENFTVDASFAYVVSPQVADIIAVQRLYGAATARTGDTTYGFNSNAGLAIYSAGTFGGDAAAPINVSYTIHDSGGTDTLDYSGYVRNLVLYLSPESPSSVGGEVGNVTIARGTLIENAVGGSGNDYIGGNEVANILVGDVGADTLVGADGNDTLLGGAGADILVGGSGNDSMVGGAGDDTYGVDVASDVVVEAPSEGFDVIYSTISLTLGANIEGLVLVDGYGPLSGTGNAFNNVLLGNSDANVLAGLAGDDIYGINGALDLVIELPGEGYDEVYSSDNYVLPANLETLFLTGYAIYGTGNDANNAIIGNNENNVLSAGDGTFEVLGGGGGTDILIGGPGHDEIYGGAGADFFRLTSVADVYGAGVNSGDFFHDFTPGLDKIQLNAANFGMNVVAAGINFFTGGTPAAAYALPTLLYQTSGFLYYDMDGTGGGAPIVLAGIGNARPLSASDFALY